MGVADSRPACTIGEGLPALSYRITRANVNNRPGDDSHQGRGLAAAASVVYSLDQETKNPEATTDVLPPALEANLPSSSSVYSHGILHPHGGRRPAARLLALRLTITPVCRQP